MSFKACHYIVLICPWNLWNVGPVENIVVHTPFERDPVAFVRPHLVLKQARRECEDAPQ